MFPDYCQEILNFHVGNYSLTSTLLCMNLNPEPSLSQPHYYHYPLFTRIREIKIKGKSKAILNFYQYLKPRNYETS